MDNSEIVEYFSESSIKFDEIVQKILNIFRKQLTLANEKEIETFGRKKFVFFLRKFFLKDVKHISVEIYSNGDVSVGFIFPPRHIGKIKVINRTSFSDQGENIWKWFQDQAEDSKKHLF